MGRKAKYDPEEHPALLKKLRVQKLQDKEIYKAFGISHQTFYRWLDTKPEFAEAYKFGVDQFVSEGISVLKKRAFGYEKEEVVQEIVYDNENKPIRKHIKKVMKHYPADSNLLKFTLTHLAPELFPDIQKIQHSGEIKNTGGRVNVSELSYEQLKVLQSIEIIEDEKETDDC